MERRAIACCLLLTTTIACCRAVKLPYYRYAGNTDALSAPAGLSHCIVVCAGGLQTSEAITTMERMSGENKSFIFQLKSRYSSVLNGFSAVMSPWAIDFIVARFDSVLSIELNGDISVQPPSIDGAFAGARALAGVDSDLLSGVQYTNSWGLDRIDQRSLPCDHLFHYPDGVYNRSTAPLIFVIDSGIRSSHQEFLSPDGTGSRVIFSWDFTTVDAATDKCDSHGTMVASIAIGRTYGVAKRANVASLKVLNCDGNSTIDTLIRALDFVAANFTSMAHRSVVLLSMETSVASAALYNATAAVVNNGHVVVVAAGNRGVDTCTQTLTSVPSAIVVGATDYTDQLAGFSNWGKCVTISAPGVNILAASNVSDTGSTTGSGTSFSAPFVAGTVAVIIERSDHQCNPGEVLSSLLNSATSVDVGAMGNVTTNLVLYQNPDGEVCTAPNSSGLSPGQIAGIVVGAVAGTVILCVCLYRRRRCCRNEDNRGDGNSTVEDRRYSAL